MKWQDTAKSSKLYNTRMANIAKPVKSRIEALLQS